MVAVLDPTALTGFRQGLFAKCSTDSRVYLIASDGAIPAIGARVATTLADDSLTPIGADWMTPGSMMTAPGSPVAVGDTGFDGRLQGVFHGESQSLWFDRGSGLQRAFVLDFSQGALPQGVTLTRASTNARRYNSSGVLVTETTDVARFDYDPRSLALRGLLIEPAATNLLLRSSTFDNATWVKTAASVTADAIADPTGATGADSLIENSATSSHLIQQSISFTSGQNYVLSVHAKANSRSRIRNNLPSAQFGGSNIQRQFNVATGEAVNAGNATASGIEAAGAGFWRTWIRHAAAATSSGSPSFWLCDDAAATSYTGDGTSNLRLWGAQLEVGLKPTSPIATTTASGTRAADVCSFTIPTGIGNLIYTFDDGSTQTVAVSPGAYTIPTNLDRPHILTIRGTA